MDKDNIKHIIQKAKSGAGEGLKRVDAVAKKAASGFSDGLDTVKDSMRKAALAKGALHELQVCIKELEEENKVRTYEDVYEETKSIIGKLKFLSKVIRKNPECCDDEIDSLINEFRIRLKELIGSDVAGEELQKIQVLSKRYDEVLLACLNAKTDIETAKIEVAVENNQNE